MFRAAAEAAGANWTLGKKISSHKQVMQLLDIFASEANNEDYVPVQSRAQEHI